MPPIFFMVIPLVSSGPIAVIPFCTFRLSCLVNFETIFERVARYGAPKWVLAGDGQVGAGQCDGTGQGKKPLHGLLNAFGGHDSF